MIQYEDECVGCPPELGCLGSSCPNRNVPHLICDNCGGERGELYNVNGEQVCDDCLLQMFPTVTLEDVESGDFDD